MHDDVTKMGGIVSAANTLLADKKAIIADFNNNMKRTLLDTSFLEKERGELLNGNSGRGGTDTERH